MRAHNVAIVTSVAAGRRRRLRLCTCICVLFLKLMLCFGEQFGRGCLRLGLCDECLQRVGWCMGGDDGMMRMCRRCDCRVF